MKNRTDFDEFLKQLEDALDNIMQEIDDSDIPGDKPVNINISINLFPLMIPGDGDICVQKPAKTPVDILETDEKVHAIIGIPGMELKNVKLTSSGRLLEITANNPEKSVIDSIELPARVNKTGMKGALKNGILEIVFNKSKKTGKSVKSQ
jgi:HSP20 family molecular chaperone IbpA